MEEGWERLTCARVTHKSLVYLSGLRKQGKVLFCHVGVESRMRWAGHVARMGKGRGVYRVLVGKPEGKRPLRRSRCR